MLTLIPECRKNWDGRQLELRRVWPALWFPQGFAFSRSGLWQWNVWPSRPEELRNGLRPFFWGFKACWSFMDLSWPDWNALVFNGKKLLTNLAGCIFWIYTSENERLVQFTWDFPPIWNPEKHGSSLAILRSRGWVVWVIFQLEPFVWILSGMWWFFWAKKTDTPWKFSRVQNALLKGNVFKLLLFWASYVIKD